MAAFPRALSRPGSPGNVLKSIQKFFAARARAKRREKPCTTPHHSGSCASRPRHSGCTSGSSAHASAPPSREPCRRLGPSSASCLPTGEARAFSRFSLGHHAQRRRIQQALGTVGGPARPRGTTAGQGRGLWQSGRRAPGLCGRRGQRRRLGGVGHGRWEQEVPTAAQVRAMQEPRLCVAAQGPQALLHVAGLPV